MQWSDGINGGFTEGNPWIQVNENTCFINAETELQDPDSVFMFYKKLIRLRKKYDIIAYGEFEQKAEKHLSIFAYKRYYRGEELLVINNFYGNQVCWGVYGDV